MQIRKAQQCYCISLCLCLLICLACPKMFTAMSDTTASHHVLLFQQTIGQLSQWQLVPPRSSRACRSGSWCHTAATSTLQDAAAQNKRKRETGNPDNVGARLQSKARNQAPVQGKLPGNSPGSASAATGSSGRANGMALLTAVKPEDEAKEQGNAALKQGDYDQVVPMCIFATLKALMPRLLQRLLHGPCRRCGCTARRSSTTAGWQQPIITGRLRISS